MFAGLKNMRTRSPHAARPELPPEFDLATYASHSDLKDLNEAELRAHWTLFGTKEGRVASPAALRENLIKLISHERSVLEIGPFFRPTLKGPQVRYFDVLDTTSLIERAKLQGLDPGGVPHIDFVSPVGDLSVVDETFAAAISAHAIEHQPDLIRHFLQVAELLEPEGRYYLVIPDKRFCFDHPFAETTAAELRVAHREGRIRHTLKSAMEHFALATHNDPLRHWAGDHYEPHYLESIPGRVMGAVRAYEDAGDGYLDVHAWQFTPNSTRALLTELTESGDIPFTLDRVYQTPRYRLEFTAVLTRTGT